MNEAPETLREMLSQAPSAPPVRDYWDTIDARKAFMKAFAVAQGGFTPLAKNRTVKIRGESKSGSPVEYTFRFADLQQIHDCTRPALSNMGLSTSMPIDHSEDGSGVWASAILSHADGYVRRSSVFVKYGDDPKKFGALLSYMRRYMLQALLDVAADDDLDEDGQGADEGFNPPRGYSNPAPAPARKTPARKPADAPPPNFDGPPAEDQEPKRRQAQEELNTSAQQPATQHERDLQRERGAAAPATVAQGTQATIDPADNPSTGAEPPAPAPAPANDPLCEDGERNYLLKRATARSPDKDPDATMRAALKDLKLDMDVKTLAGLRKSQWTLIKGKV